MALPTRKPNRLADCAYSQNGAYFITICTQNRLPSLGKLGRGDPGGRPQFTATPLGALAAQAMEEMETRFAVAVDRYVIMPNHIHLILRLEGARATARVAPTVGAVIGGYKSLVATQWLALCKQEHRTMGAVWQRSFYDHIIRNEREYLEIWNYIETNPQRWEEDELHVF